MPAAGVGVQGGQVPQGYGNTAQVMAAGHFLYYTNAAFTAARIWTLPSCAAHGVGDLIVADVQGTLTAANTLTLTAAGSDQVNNAGAASSVPPMGRAYDAVRLHCDGASPGKWTTLNLPTGSVLAGTTQTITAAQWAIFDIFDVATAAQTLTFPASSGLSPQGGVVVKADTQSITLTANAADAFNGGATGGSVTVPAGVLAIVTTDGAGALKVNLGQTTGSGTVTNAANLTDHAPVIGAGGTTGVKTIAPMTNGQMVVGATGADPAPQTMSQDCTTNASLVMVCTKTNNVSFGSAATANTGTSGATIPLNNGNNTHSGVETFGTVVGGGRIVSGTTDGPTAADCGTTIHFTSGSGITVTMPNNITTLQCTITFIQEGAGQITFAAGSGATIHNRSSFTKTAGQWGVVDMILNTNAGGTSAVYTLAGDGA